MMTHERNSHEKRIIDDLFATMVRDRATQAPMATKKRGVKLE